MFRCHVCGSTVAKKVIIDEVFRIDHRHILVERIPAIMCDHCGEQVISRDTTEKIRRMIHSKAAPQKSISMDVFNYA